MYYNIIINTYGSYIRGGNIMASTVNSAFMEFMKDKVNLNSEKTKIARTSRDNLINNIHDLGSKNDFFNLYNNIDVSFGSFSRRTKIRPLDDIDIMIGLHADSSTYLEIGTEIKIYVNNIYSPQYKCCNYNTNILNSTIVINRFISELDKLNDYKKAETHKNGAAATLQLKSYDWNFDIVPCFITKEDFQGKDYYLIPDGKGNWQKTDPRIDRYRVIALNQKHNGLMLDIIRLVKYWNKRPTMPSMKSYTLECLILQFFDSTIKVSNWIDFNFRDLLQYINNNIWYPIYDPKGIQGDINTLTISEKMKISERATRDYNKANEAIYAETVEKDQEKSILKWSEIFGNEFPKYS